MAIAVMAKGTFAVKGKKSHSEHTESIFSVQRKQDFQLLSCHFIQRCPWRSLREASRAELFPRIWQFWNILPLLAL